MLDTVMVSVGAVILVVFLSAVGGIPIGHLVGRKKFGVYITKTGSGGIGATNFERALLEAGIDPKVAKRWRLIVEAADQLKGLAPTLIAIYALKFTSLGLLVLGVCLILGHCYSMFLGFKGGKGVATTMGVATGLCPWLAVPCYLYWFANKKVLAKYTAESTALASICAGLLLGLGGVILYSQDVNVLGIQISRPDIYLQILFAFSALHIVFAHRANLRRYHEEQKQVKTEAAATKPKKRKIGGDIPTGVFISDAASNDPDTVKRLLMQKKKFAWLIRPLPAKFVMNCVLPILPMKKLKMSETIIKGKDGKLARVIVWGYPRTPKWMMAHQKKAVGELVSLVCYLEKIGADKICLGANTAVVGDKGKTIQGSVQIPVTNGNRLTSGMAVAGALELAKLMGLDLSKTTATVVGPGGSVGDGVCRMLLKAGVARLLLVGSGLGKQSKQAEELTLAFGIEVIECSLQNALEQSQIAIFASSATSRELKHELCPISLPPGLIVVDMERPRGVSKDLALIPWLLPNDGTMVEIESEGKAGLGLPLGIYFPCFSELALMLLRGWNNKWCYPATLAEIESVLESAFDEGFKLASFRLNEKPLTSEDIAERIVAAHEEAKRRAA